jgi:hypothetical protein
VNQSGSSTSSPGLEKLSSSTPNPSPSGISPPKSNSSLSSAAISGSSAAWTSPSALESPLGVLPLYCWRIDSSARSRMSVASLYPSWSGSGRGTSASFSGSTSIRTLSISRRSSRLSSSTPLAISVRIVSGSLMNAWAVAATSVYVLRPFLMR